MQSLDGLQNCWLDWTLLGGFGKSGGAPKGTFEGREVSGRLLLELFAGVAGGGISYESKSSILL